MSASAGNDIDAIRRRDAELVQVVDAAMAEAARRSGDWVRCRAGCTPCCLGPFGISALDAMRLRDGMADLAGREPERAAAVRGRADRYAAEISEWLPAAAEGGYDFDDEAELPESWDDVPCPALDPDTGRCDLYAWRPIPCRRFGAATKVDGGVAACELCYEGASDEEIAACAVELDPEGLEEALLAGEADRGQSLVAFALRSGREEAE